jgi:hypothetical protein
MRHISFGWVIPRCTYINFDDNTVFLGSARLARLAPAAVFSLASSADHRGAAKVGVAEGAGIIAILDSFAKFQFVLINRKERGL